MNTTTEGKTTLSLPEVAEKLGLKAPSFLHEAENDKQRLVDKLTTAVLNSATGQEFRDAAERIISEAYVCATYYTYLSQGATVDDPLFAILKQVKEEEAG